MLHRLARHFQRNQSKAKAQPCMLESLENRRMLAVSPIVAGTKIKGINLSENNISINSTLITIPFTGNINLVDVSKLRLFGYATNPMSATLGQVKKTVHITKAEVLELDADGDGDLDRSLLQLTTDRLMRKGGTIVINEGALTDDNGDVVATHERKTIKGQNKERFTLACRLFVVTDQTRFTSDLYDGANPATAGSVVPEATATANLTAFLNQKVAGGVITQAQMDAALARYNDDATKGIFPDHNLRAALFSLTGTFAESAISVYLDGNNLTGKPYTIVTFAAPDDPTVPVAQTSVRESDGRLRTIFKPEFQSEPIQALSAWLAHEALHQDTSIGLQEETYATIVEVLIYAQQAQHQILGGTKPVSTVVANNTKLVNLENEKLAAMLQSGRTIFPYPGVYDAPHTINQNLGIFVGQKAATDGGGVYTGWHNFITRGYIARGAVSQNTAGLPLLTTYHTAITGEAPAPNAQFSNALIDDVDNFQGILSTRLTMQLANGLRMGLAS